MKKAVLFILLASLPVITQAQVQLALGPAVGGGFYHKSEESWTTWYEENKATVLLSVTLDMQFASRWGVIFWLDASNSNYLCVSPTIKYCFLRRPVYLFAGPAFGANYDFDLSSYRFDVRLGGGYDFFINRKFTISPFLYGSYGFPDIEYTCDRIGTIQLGAAFRFGIN